jgi:hypothetical protein
MMPPWLWLRRSPRRLRPLPPPSPPGEKVGILLAQHFDDVGLLVVRHHQVLADDYLH